MLEGFRQCGGVSKEETVASWSQEQESGTQVDPKWKDVAVMSTPTTKIWAGPQCAVESPCMRITCFPDRRVVQHLFTRGKANVLCREIFLNSLEGLSTMVVEGIMGEGLN